VKTLLVLFLTFSGGAAVGTVAVAGLTAAVDPDTAAVEEFQQADEPIDVLVYGERG
jgi:hypothetical protein